MPYYELPPQYEYRAVQPQEHSAQSTFVLLAEKLEPETCQVLKIFDELGILAIYGDYNGGHDEGFAELNRVELAGGETILAEDLTLKLVSGPISQIQPKALRQYYGGTLVSPEQKVDFLLESVANDLATFLLGDGYGTGEFSMYGSFKFNLATGTIIDIQEDN